MYEVDVYFESTFIQSITNFFFFFDSIFEGVYFVCEKITGLLQGHKDFS